MYTKRLTYKDFDGNERTEDFCFNLTAAELAKMELSKSGGMDKVINRIIDAKDNSQLIDMFTQLLESAYGVKTDDGRGFIKNERTLENFTCTQAYSDYYMQLCTDTDEALAFILGVMPPEVTKNMTEETKNAIKSGDTEKIIANTINGPVAVN